MLKSGKVNLIQKMLFQSARFSSTAPQVKAKSFEDVPGPTLLPVVGSSWKYFPVVGEFDLKNLGAAAETLFDRYGPIVKQKGGPHSIVHLFDPQDFEVVYKLCQQTSQHFRVSFFVLKNYRESKPHLYNSTGLLAGQGDQWWNARKTPQKVLSPLKKAKTFLSQDDNIIKEFVGKFCEKGKVEDYLALANRLNMELTTLYLFGERHYCFDYPQTDPDSYQSKILEYILTFLDSSAYFDQSQLHWSMPTKKELQRFYEEMEIIENYTIEMIEKVKKSNDPEDRCIIAELMRDYANHNIDLGSVIDLLYAGVETTALISTSFLHELGMNKRVQDKVREEAVRLLPKGKESEITAETLSQATYLKAAIKENFRLNPIVTFQNRKLPESVQLGGYLIPRDTIVFLELWAACRMECNFKDPLEFKPERWLKTSQEYEESNSYSVLQFGLGIRTCIARRRAEQILCTILLRILSEYEISHDGNKMERVTPFLYKPAQPINFIFTKKT